MPSTVFNCFVFLLVFVIPKCRAGLNVLSAVSHISRPLQTLAKNNKDFIQIASENGYHAETHRVTTDDGYVLTMFRIPPGVNCTKSPMLLMHGLLQSAECFLDAPGFLLAREGYDVWFGNARGNYHSRRHLNWNPDTDREYWKFSVDEMASYDVPAMIDHVLDASDTDELIYVGFSRGAGTFIAMNSERPEYSDKVSLFIALAPATRHYHTKSVGYRLLAESLNATRAPLEATGVWEVLSRGRSGEPCRAEPLAAVVCGPAATVVDSPHPDSITPETEKRVFEHTPAGTSVQNLAWYGQSMNSLKFVKFDYGSDKNAEMYGSPEPPEYDLSAVRTPTVVFHGAADVLDYVRVKDPLWNHLDMTYSRYWKERIFVYIKKYLNKYDHIY